MGLAGGSLDRLVLFKVNESLMGFSSFSPYAGSDRSVPALCTHSHSNSPVSYESVILIHFVTLTSVF